MKKHLFLLPVIVLLSAACGSGQPPTNNLPPATVQKPQVSPITQTVPSPAASIIGKLYENDYIKITIPSGWVAKAANRSSYFPCSSAPGCQSKTAPDPASLNITKGNYILFINARAGQASGVEGGRFEEYAGGAPSVDALIIDHPGGPCGTWTDTAISVNSEQLPRRDYFVSPSDNQGDCRKPTVNKTLWYLSVVGGGINYFNVPNFSPAAGWVVTMAYNNKGINSFPEKNSPGLVAMLSEMSDMVSTLTIKAPTPYTPDVSAAINNIGDTYWTTQFYEGAESAPVTCSNSGSGSKIDMANIAKSLHMESLGPNDKVGYKSNNDLEQRIQIIEAILKDNGWSNCNTFSPGRTSWVDVYQKGKELANVDKNYSYGYFDIFLDFYLLK
jgi:hypothetical protein